jgi:hypothetical protein
LKTREGFNTINEPVPKSLPKVDACGEESGAPTPEEMKSAIDRVASSRSFQRADRLRSLLVYVCEATLRGDGANLNEHMLGLEVFRRGPDYSPSEDAIVRRMAHALRQKLERYYAEEGNADPVRIELPTGRYIAHFRANPQPEPAVPELNAVPPAEVPARPSIAFKGAWTVVAAVALLGIGLLAGKLLFKGKVRPISNSAPVPGAIRALWGNWLQDPMGATICLSNPMTLGVHEVNGATAAYKFAVPGAYVERFNKNYKLTGDGRLYLSFDLGHGKLGEAESAIVLGAFLGRAGIPVGATQERSTSWEDFRSKNLILFGHQEINHFVEPLLDRYPLRQVGIAKRIVNREPRAGEQVEYELQRLNSAGRPIENYVLISMIPGLDARRHLLLVTGLESPAAALAIDYLTDSEKAAELVQQLRAAAPPGKDIRYFQALVKGYIRDRVPTEGSIVLVRVL